MTQNLFIATGIFHPESGGPATYLYRILPHLQNKGWDIRLLTYGEGDTESYPYPLRRIPRQLLPVRLLRYGLASQSVLRWADVAYLHTTDLPLIGSSDVPRVIKIVGDQAWERCIRKDWIPPTMDIDDFQTADVGFWASRARQSRARQVQAMDGVVVPSEYLKRMVMGWGVDEAKIKVIYNALPNQTDTERVSMSQAREQLNLPNEVPLLLTVARLTAWKGIAHILSASEHLPNVHLLVAGDGPMRAQLESQAQSLGKRVTFLGRVPREQMALYMQASDYVVLYSGYEGLPHTLLESLSLGTPVIASDKGGNPEVVQHNINGLLIPYVDVDALTDTIRQAFESGKREQLASQSSVGMERFQFEQMVSLTDAYLRSFL